MVKNNKPDRLEEFRQITAEFNAMKNRIRRLIGSKHFPTDGEWKECIVREFLRRNLPETIKVGRGFVITNKGPTTQIDVLIYDGSKPVLFREGSLVCVTPDAVKGIIEVKTNLGSDPVEETLCKLCNNIDMIKSQPGGFSIIAGLFAIESGHVTEKRLIEAIISAADNNSRKALDIASFGSDTFIKYYDLWPNPDSEGRVKYDKWHIYELIQCAPAYFLVNIFEAICGDSVRLYPKLWYPEGGKVRHIKGIFTLNSKIEQLK